MECHECNKKFKPNSHNAKYCSKECKYSAHKKLSESKERETIKKLKCNNCNKVQTVNNFYKAAWCKSGYRPTCKICREDQNLKRVYGVDVNWFNENSKNGCQICGRRKEDGRKIKGTSKHYRLCVDHCHKTGKTRGVVCNDCNRNLGMYFDDEEMYNNVMNYLKKNE